MKTSIASSSTRSSTHGDDLLKTRDIGDQIESQSLHRPVADFVSGGGKRIRGSLMQVAFAMAGGRGEIPSVVVDAIECLHAGSLVIDDIQDASLLRRGQPTMHREIGTPLAINAGNWMYFQALDMIQSAGLTLIQKHRLCQAMVRTGRVCHEGQAIDLAARVDQILPEDWRSVAERISAKKTGSLVALAMQFGAIAADASEDLIAEFRRYGMRVGVALQMRNDLDELVGLVAVDDDTTDLVRWDDLKNGRVTWNWAWLADQAETTTSRLMAERLQLACRSPRSTALLSELASFLLSVVNDCGNDAIGNEIDEAICLLGEHVIDENLLNRFREILQPIRISQVKGRLQKIIEESAPSSVELMR
ncbi:MAG: polyprenyl synthetase family protein [Planctomycetota bacterium]